MAFYCTPFFLINAVTHVFPLVQLQNSRMVIQERDRVIKELEEKVAFLEAEVSTYMRTSHPTSIFVTNFSCIHHMAQSLVYTEQRAAWSGGLFPEWSKVKFRPFVRFQSSDCLQVTHIHAPAQMSPIQIKCIPSFCLPLFHSKPLKPSTQSNKNLPFIKVIEIKSWALLWQRCKNIIITWTRQVDRWLRTPSSTTACQATRSHAKNHSGVIPLLSILLTNMHDCSATQNASSTVSYVTNQLYCVLM